MMKKSMSTETSVPAALQNHTKEEESVKKKDAVQRMTRETSC